MEDSKIIQDWYEHPPKEDGQGVFVMVDKKGLGRWCHSGNELRRVHELNPDEWMTGPIYMPVSVEDMNRFNDWLENDW